MWHRSKATGGDGPGVAAPAAVPPTLDQRLGLVTRQGHEKAKISSSRGDAAKRPPLVAGFVAVVCIAVLALSGWREWTSRDAVLRAAEVDVRNLARSLAKNAESTFQLADTVLIGLVNRLETDGTGPAALEKIQGIIDIRKATMGRVRGLFIYDETGRWLATSEKVNLDGLNNSDRIYFQRHRDSPDRDVMIGRPVKSRSGGQWVISVSRRFNHPDGSFAGVVAASVNSAYFSELYKEFDVGPNGAISLLSAGGIMLARSVDNGSYVDRDLSGTPLIKELSWRPSEGLYYFQSSLDGIWRLSFYQLTERYPLLVLVTKAQDDVLADWRNEASARLAFTLALTTLIATAGFFLVRQLRERQRMTVALAAKEADFRLLAEESSDIVMRIGLDERILYISPSCERILGWKADHFEGVSALAGVNRDDLPRVEQTVAALKRGDIQETKLIYRARRREENEIWLETSLRVTRHPETGEIDGVVAIARDMTEHKDLEQKLGELAALDWLTGLANRRRFDEQLQKEWARAIRERTPLSLLLIDADHFKEFNDQHGHQAGDGCLKALARILAGQALRPADLAARYGGEEFVLLLPNTDEGGTELVGQRIRQALRELALPHALNSPTKGLTVSLGGATDRPTTETAAGGASLIAAADRALYVAKSDGRDRLVMSAK